jgi:hypothetical protein
MLSSAMGCWQALGPGGCLDFGLEMTPAMGLIKLFGVKREVK